MDNLSVGQSIARVGVLVPGIAALIVLVLVLIFLWFKNPKLFRLKLIGLHYEGFDPSHAERRSAKNKLPLAKAKPRKRAGSATKTRSTTTTRRAARSR